VSGLVDHLLECGRVEISRAEISDHGVGAGELANSRVVGVGGGVDQLGGGDAAAHVLVRGLRPGIAPRRILEQVGEGAVEERLHVGVRYIGDLRIGL